MKLDNSVWMNRRGVSMTKNKVSDCKVHHKIIQSGVRFCGDEVTDNISMKIDTYNGGELSLIE